MQSRDLLYIFFGYLSGSILFARLAGQIFCHKDITAKSTDRNPGTANAFRYGGFWCGVVTLLGDLLKGYLPVHLYLEEIPPVIGGISLAFVMAAPVFGHIFPIFYRFRGGKGIAVSFGCLLGLIPDVTPFAVLAGAFIFFSVIIKVSPDYHKTMIVYIVSTAAVIISECELPVRIGFLLIAILIMMKLLSSREEKEAFRMEAVWKH